ncbi:MAG: thioesterase family protein [Pseudomonadota bacterium]
MSEFETKPIRTQTREVPTEWIDYNGHMNVAYYLMAIDQALDEAFDAVGVGIDLVQKFGMGPMALVNTIHYLDELFAGQHYYCEAQLLDADHKRMHMFVTMHHVEKGTIAATYETLSMNVDLTARRSANYPDVVASRIQGLLEAHKDLPWPDQVGAGIGIRRKAAE